MKSKKLHHVKLVVGHQDEIKEPMNKKILVDFALETTKRKLLRMKAIAGLRGSYTNEQIVNNFIKTALYKLYGF